MGIPSLDYHMRQAKADKETKALHDFCREHVDLKIQKLVDEANRTLQVTNERRDKAAKQLSELARTFEGDLTTEEREDLMKRAQQSAKEIKDYDEGLEQISHRLVADIRKLEDEYAAIAARKVVAPGKPKTITLKKDGNRKTEAVEVTYDDGSENKIEVEREAE